MEFYMQECAVAFDRAVAVKRTAFPWDVKLHAHIRPYAIEGSREMIDAGYHREAMFAIELFLVLSIIAIQNDAPEEEKPRFQALFGCFLGDLGLTTPADWRSRLERARKLAEEVFGVADEIVESNAEIAD